MPHLDLIPKVEYTSIGATHESIQLEIITANFTEVDQIVVEISNANYSESVR